MANRITATVLRNLKEYLETDDGSIYDFLKEYGLDIRPVRLKVKLEEEYGEDVVSEILINKRTRKNGNKLKSIEEIDKRIARLNSMVQKLEDLKTKLQ